MKNHNIKELELIIKKYNLKTNGSLNHYSLHKSWVLKRNLLNELEVLDFFKIFDSENKSKLIYTLLNPLSNICSNIKCKSNIEPRYKGFKEGFQKYCFKCSTKIKYSTKKIKESIINPDTKFKLRNKLKLLINELKTKDLTKYDSNKIRNIKNTILYNDILNTTYYIPLTNKFNERLYHIENNLTEIPKYIDCNKELDNFISVTKGYLNNRCKNGCQIKHSIKHRTKSLKLLNTLYKKYENFYSKLNTDEYLNTGLSKSKYFKYILYNKEIPVIKFTHLKCGHTYYRNLTYQGTLQCPKCYHTRSKQQYLIHNFIEKEIGFSSSFNNRHILNGKELDLYFDNIKLAIEYNGQKFHSFGKSTCKMFNNYELEYKDKYKHLTKTELCETKDIQLLHIFSSEWLDLNKQNIWKSIIKSKFDYSEQILENCKCCIKEINSKESSEFLKLNHLEGTIESDIRIGLFYEQELIQVMVFKLIKDKEYELTRFSTKNGLNIELNKHTNMLRYFEIEYKPSLIKSLVNRRWNMDSEQIIYRKLGFKYIGTTDIKYFYIEGNSFDTAELSIIKSLNTRKIYDSGYLVYIKRV